MKTIIVILGGLISGYVIANLEDKRLDEITEDLLGKADLWLEEIQKFIGETLDGIEGADSETIKLNIDSFVAALTESVDEFLDIEDFDERIKYVEEKMAEVSVNLIKRADKLGAK